MRNVIEIYAFDSHSVIIGKAEFSGEMRSTEHAAFVCAVAMKRMDGVRTIHIDFTRTNLRAECDLLNTRTHIGGDWYIEDIDNDALTDNAKEILAAIKEIEGRVEAIVT